MEPLRLNKCIIKLDRVTLLDKVIFKTEMFWEDDISGA